MKNNMTKRLIDLESLVRDNIYNLKPYSSARDDYNGSEGIFLDANENPFGTLNRYPDPYQNILKQKLAKIKNVDSRQIFIGNGSDEVIDLALRIFCNPCLDKGLCFTPSYGMYAVSSDINNIELIKLPLTNDFQIDRNTVTPYLSDSKLKVIFICSPNNPTGNLINKSDIEYFLDNFSGIVIVDEAYVDFADSDSLINLLDTYNNLIVSQTFSKAWGIAAARVGVAYSNELIISLFNKVKPPYNVSRLNQEAAISALESYDSFRENISTILAEKTKMKMELQDCKVVNKVYPSDANFFLIEVNDADNVYKQLKDQGIIIRNRNKEVENCVRVTIGSQSENEILIKSLKNL